MNNIPALFQIMAWRRPGDTPLSEPMLVSLLTHICVTQPQWVNSSSPIAHEMRLWIAPALVQIMACRRAILSANAGLLSIEPLGTDCNEIPIQICYTLESWVNIAPGIGMFNPVSRDFDRGAIVNLIGAFVKNCSRIRCVVKLFMVIYRILVCLVDALAQLMRGNLFRMRPVRKVNVKCGFNYIVRFL